MARKTVEELAIAISMESDGFKKEMTSINGLIRKTEKEFKAAGKGVDNYEKTFVGLDSKIQKTSKQIELYNKKLTAQQNEHKKTSKALEDNKKKLDESEKELKKIEETQGKNSKAWEKQSKIVEKNSDLVHKNAQKIIGLSGDIKTTEGNINKLNRELEESQKEFDNLGKKTQTLDDKLENITTQSNLTQSEFNKLGSELQKNGGYFQKLGNEMNKLSSEISSGVNKINAYENEIDKLSKTLDDQKNEYSQLESKIQTYSQHLDRASSMYGENSSQANEYRQKLMQLKDSYNQVETEIEQNNRELTQYKTQLNNVKTEVNQLSNELKQMPFDKVSESLKNTGSSIKSVGQGLTAGVTVPIGVAAGAATKASLDFESAFTGVVKTVDMTTSEMATMEQGIRDLSKEMPPAATEIAGVAEAAGQLGIKKESILSFSKTMVQLGDTTNLSADEAATSMSRLANITGMSQNDFDKLGSTVVALGNNMATTEADIVAMGMRLAGAGSQVGMTEAQIMSFASALSSVGIEAEAGGSAFSKVMIEMQLATEKGGDSLDNFAKVAGMSSSEFKQAFETDATTAIMKFIEGLGSAEERGLSAIGILDNMGISEVRLRDTLLRAAGASGTFSEALNIGTNAWKENTALTKEAETRYSTNASQLEIMRNKITDASVTIGNNLMPAILSCAEWVAKLSEKFSNLDSSTQQTIIVTAAMAAAIGPLLMGIGQLIIVGGNSVTLFGKLKGSMVGNVAASTGLTSALGFLASPVGIGAAIVAIGGLIAMIGDNENAILKLQEKFGGFGTVIGGVCEFVSGHVQLTFGNLAIAIMGVFDIIGAIIDGPGGATVDDAVKGMTAKMNLNTEEAMGKIVLTTTRGMSQMRNATDEQLNGTVTSMNTIMDAIPRIVDGKYRTASQALGQQLHNMDFTQLSILQGMNDTTKMMFQGIVEGMSVEQASKKVEQNLKEMAAAGKIDADTMQKDISQAMEHMKQQMDTKTKEGADKVNTNTKTTETQAVQNAKNTNDGVTKEFKDMSSNVDKSTKESGNKSKANMDNWAKDAGNATNNMANEAKKGTGKLVTNTDTDMKNANKAVQQSATDMYNGSKKSYSKMADVARIEGTRMYNGVSTSAEKMAQKAKSSASDMYRGVTTSTRLMANAAISDWNRIRNAYSRPISGTVTKTTINRSFSEGVGKITKELPNISGSYTIPREANLKLSNSYLANFAMPRIDTSKYVTRGSYYNSNSYNSSFSSESRSTSTKKLEDKLDILINLMSDLLYKKEESPNKSNFVELRLSNNAGRRIAELIAPFGEVIEDYKTERDPRFV